MRILSIDAWKDMGGWTWNQWYEVDSISNEAFKALDTNRKILKYFRDEGYLKPESAGKCGVEDDQYNVVIFERSNGRPLYAIEYGWQEQSENE